MHQLQMFDELVLLVVNKLHHPCADLLVEGMEHIHNQCDCYYVRRMQRDVSSPLCRQASDPKKLLELAAEIIRLLDEKEYRLVHRAAKPDGDPTPPL